MVTKSYIDTQISGITWREPVDMASDLANYLDEPGTARLAKDTNYGYVKDGHTWMPFTGPGNADREAPPPIHTNVVDRLAELADD